MSGSGIGPVEPGEGTSGDDEPDDHTGPGPAPDARPAPGTGDPSGLTRPGGPAAPTGPLRALLRRAEARYARHRLAAALLAGTVVLGACGGYLYSVRPRPPAPAAAPRPAAPSQTLSLSYGEALATPSPGSVFAFTVRARISSGPTVTIERIGQPSRALTVTVRPPSPLVVAVGEVREAVVEIQVADCVHVARNAGLPFLEVTLSNGFQKEDHSYILGDRYAMDLSTALTRACPEGRDVSPPPPS
ncbi:Tat pathway signal sequence domain protein [Streptomyces sp. G-G2]|uniref:Tat pathway signal sequence domain protein n=1 Tax=Streptomyces sp. G-G2 TaxID=3046201 RepID=UPI0024B99412|nr:Tat pathway signal sequence domain protein [Streptomyces sp. G-G2]MDJ0384299.1 Tat pathway signal sequence domain protein [Streptomyces sp. G-G2]